MLARRVARNKRQRRAGRHQAPEPELELEPAPVLALALAVLALANTVRPPRPMQPSVVHRKRVGSMEPTQIH